jgi:hypothetical protein
MKLSRLLIVLLFVLLGHSATSRPMIALANTVRHGTDFGTATFSEGDIISASSFQSEHQTITPPSSALAPPYRKHLKARPPS